MEDNQHALNQQLSTESHFTKSLSLSGSAVLMQAIYVSHLHQQQLEVHYSQVSQVPIFKSLFN